MRVAFVCLPTVIWLLWFGVQPMRDAAFPRHSIAGGLLGLIQMLFYYPLLPIAEGLTKLFYLSIPYTVIWTIGLWWCLLRPRRQSQGEVEGAPAKPAKKPLWLLMLFGVILILTPFYPIQAYKPIGRFPQESRALIMLDRRDRGEIEDLRGKSKGAVRAILGEPQNTDIEAEVWVWIFDWKDYQSRGLPQDWKSMAGNAPGDGLWIRFESDRCVSQFPVSFSASDPLEVLQEE